MREDGSVPSEFPTKNFTAVHQNYRLQPKFRQVIEAIHENIEKCIFKNVICQKSEVKSLFIIGFFNNFTIKNCLTQHFWLLFKQFSMFSKKENKQTISNMSILKMKENSTWTKMIFPINGWNMLFSDWPKWVDWNNQRSAANTKRASWYCTECSGTEASFCFRGWHASTTAICPSTRKVTTNLLPESAKKLEAEHTPSIKCWLIRGTVRTL